MADNARLEDLRKRYHENPRRFFAPLANEYRKAGFLDRAVLLCEKHLAEQPENMNGLVVYGQTLFDSGRLDDARAPFEQALGVDPENLIALRHLGDIARLGGDADAARGWYQKVLEVDRRNDEVLDLLEQMDAAGPTAPTSTAPSSAPAPGGKGSTVVINAQAMADADRREADAMMSFGTEIDLPAEPAAPSVSESPADAAAPEALAAAPQPLAAEPEPLAAEPELLDLEISDDFGFAPPAAAAPAAEPPSAEPPATPEFEIPAPEPKATPAAPTRSTTPSLGTPRAGTPRTGTPRAGTPRASTPAAATPTASAPKKRTSLLDLNFDFSDIPEAPAAAPLPEVPMLGADAAEYGIGAEPPLAQPAADSAPEPLGQSDAEMFVESDPTLSDFADELAVEASPEGASLAAAEDTVAEAAASEPALPPGDFELADFSADVSPMAGLESTEFQGGEAAPLEGLELAGADVVGPADTSLAAASPAADATVPAAADSAVEEPSAVAEPAGAEPAAAEPAAAEPAAVEPAAAAPSAADLLGDLPPLDEPAPEPSEPSRKPRMTKADLASLPLLADFGLEDDVPEEPPARPSKATPTFVTETMAELYVKQGFTEEAIAVYRQLIAQSPGDDSLRRKLAALEQRDEGMPEFEEPSADAPEPTPAAPTAALDEVSFAGVGLTTPTPTSGRLVTPAAVGGPTAREFLAGFARRPAAPNAVGDGGPSAEAEAAAESAVAVAEVPALEMPEDVAPIEEPPTTVPASAWPLDALFGAPSDVRDLGAAETIAGIATFEGPDGGTGLDELLSEGSSAPRRSVPRASQSLKFDQFFQPTAPIEENLPEMPSADPGDDDLDQFNDWLKGLKPEG